MGQGLGKELGKGALYYENLGELEQYLARLRTNDPTLVELDLANRYLGTEGAEVGSSALIGNTHLQKLNLSYNRLDGPIVGKLTSCLEKNSSVTELSLSGNSLGEEGAKLVADLLYKTSSLTSLKLFNCGLDDFAALHLANALQHNKSVEELRLDMNHLTDAAAEMLAKCLRRNVTLTRLSLSQNDGISDRWLGDIQQALERNHQTQAEARARKEKKKVLSNQRKQEVEKQRKDAEETLVREREALVDQTRELEEKQRQQEEEEQRVQEDRASRQQKGSYDRQRHHQEMENYIQTVVGNAYRWREQIQTRPTRGWWSGFTPRPELSDDGSGSPTSVDPYLPERRLVPHFKAPENPGGPLQLCYRYPHATRKPKETAASFFASQARDPAAADR
eukprot:TRINITY_DN47704_c0_g1_i1.p1 TRINITY_DN47704_c0_g1~~TRINITY_DN47704_c0_g1_i1.p1  ORF type:complete len:417 (+),score=155.43 TRINITY_DN47704_c0_g1_i1:77-1252(+)